MAGPSSPARWAKTQQKKDSPAYLHPSITKKYTPDTNSIIHQLPTELTDAGRVWWNQYAGAGKEFESSKGRRGGWDGASRWVREKYVTKWWPEHFPQAKDASYMDRAWFLRQSGMSRLIRAHLDNWKRAEEKTNNPATAAKLKRTQKPLATSFRKKILAHDVYRRAHPSPYEKALKEWEELYGEKPQVDERRKISYSVYKNLPKDKQEEWRDKAVEALKESRRLAKITDPEERAQFLKRFWKALRELLTEASTVAGVEVCALIVHEGKDGETLVSREILKGIQGFSNSEGLANAMDALKNFIEASTGDDIVYKFPVPTVYPDYSRDGYPCLPKYEGWSLKRLQKLLRDFIKAIFKFQGAVGRMIWKEMKAAMDYWFDPQRLPKVKNLVFDDPSQLDIDMINIWLTFLWACLTGQVPPEERFQFLRVPAGPTPIHPSDSQETRRELVERDGKKVYVLVFVDLVDKCHRVGGMSYKQPAIDFADAIAAGSTHANASSAPPSRWLGLPTFSPSVLSSVFTGAELESLRILASLLPEAAKTRVINLIEVTNEYQAHIPATHPLGVWLRNGGIPLVLARSPQEAPALGTSSPFWLPWYYFLPGGGPVEGTLYFFEIFQDELRTTDVILHTSSKTFYGGHTGIACVVRPLIQIYVNCLAIRGDFKPPEDPPSKCDTSRFNVQEHDRIVGWMDQWIETIKEHTKILRETSSERKEGLATIQVQPNKSESDTSDDSSDETAPITMPMPPASTPPVAGPSTQRKSQSKGKKPAKARKFADYTSSSDSEDYTNNNRTLEVDYDALDKASEDDEWTDEEELDAFDERFLADDAFPPYDPLGLRARYDLDPDVRQHIHHGCIPYQGIISEDQWDPETNEPIFGGFPELPPHKPLRLTRPESLMRELISLEQQAKRMRENWELYNRNNPRFGQNLRHWSKEVAIIAPDPYRPLFRLLHIRLMTWLRAKAMAPYVFAHWKAMSIVGREAPHLYVIAKHFLDENDFPDPSITAQDLLAQLNKSKKQIIELGYICTELKDWHALSTRFFNELHGSWLIRGIPDTVGEVITITDGIIRWTTATRKLGEKHAAERPQTWRSVSETPFPETRAPTNYLFGCPSPNELPSDLYKLELARKANPFDRMMEAIRVNLEVLASDPPMEVSPATSPNFTPRLSPVDCMSEAIPDMGLKHASEAKSEEMVAVSVASCDLPPLPSIDLSTPVQDPEPQPELKESSPPPPPSSSLPPSPPPLASPPPERLREPEPKPGTVTVAESKAEPTSRPNVIPSPPSSSFSPLPPPSLSSPPPPQRRLRKDKLTPRTELQPDLLPQPESSRPQRSSARLQAKTDPPQASDVPKEGQPGRRVLPRRSNRK